MAGSGGFTVLRAHGGDRFYDHPGMRSHCHQQQQLVLHHHHQQQQQQHLRQLHMPMKWESSEEVDTRNDSKDSTLSKPSVSSSTHSPPPSNSSTNLDRVMESVTPFVPAQSSPEASPRVWKKTHESKSQPFYSLGDLWESFREWSVYGVGVPLLLNGRDSVKQYYVPFLSGIQLYVDPSKAPRRQPGKDSDAQSLRESSSNCSNDYDVDRQAKSITDSARNQQSSTHFNSQRLSKLSLRDNPQMDPSSSEVGDCNMMGSLVFEYLEHDQPHHRKPLSDKVSILASQFPELRMYKSCDLLPSSWFSVAWYPIYRIPVGPTLQNLDASFLTFHALSTHSKSAGQPQLHGLSNKIFGEDASSKFSLPVFGLASYKLKGSILTPNKPNECQQEDSLLQSADNWLKRLEVDLPDYRFFLSHTLQRR